MPFPVIPVLASASVFGLLLLSRKKTTPLDRGTKPEPIPKNGGVGPVRRNRPDPFPPGAGEATVIPNAAGGIRTRSGPGTSNQVLAPDGDPRLAYNGDTVAVIETGIAEQGGGAGEWWKIITPGGLEGYSRAVDAAGVSNFTLVRSPQGGRGEQPIRTFAGVGAAYRPTYWRQHARPWGYARY